MIVLRVHRVHLTFQVGDKMALYFYCVEYTLTLYSFDIKSSSTVKTSGVIEAEINSTNDFYTLKNEILESIHHSVGRDTLVSNISLIALNPL